MIVLACNTASAICFDKLNKTCRDIPIVTIKPNTDIKKFADKPTLVLVTDNTAKYSLELAKTKKVSNIYVKSFSDLAKKIDDSNGKFDSLFEYLNDELSRYRKYNIKNIVLGCTHYNFLKYQLVKIFGDVQFFENSEQVAKICKKILKEKELLKKSKDGRTITFCKI